MIKHNWDSYKVGKRTKAVLIELNISSKKELRLLLEKDVTILWRLPHIGETTIKELLVIAFN